MQEFFSIGEVCTLTDLKPHVLRYWETQFKVLSPAKNRSGNRVYARREVELILFVKHLLYTEKYTIDGARQRLDAQRRSGELRPAARAALARETTDAMERELRGIVEVLEGRAPVARPSAGEGPGEVTEPASATAVPIR
ncbi:MAG: MerR family transcriptional regulator [Gemmatirosa sp.]